MLDMFRSRRLVLTGGIVAVASCSAGSEPSTFTENVDVTVCDPGQPGFSADITNAFLPFPVGAAWVLEGTEDGQQVRLVVSSLDQTEDIAGETTRVMEERETHDGTLVEVSRNFLTQTPDGTVCYYGEDVDIYDGGAIVSHEGAWRAGVANALPGILMPGSPAVGMAFRQERAPGVAEDRVEITAVDETVTVPAGTFANTVRFLETTPLEPGSESGKVYVRDVGLIVDDAVQRVSEAP
jgi:hypothetical protein